MNIPQGGDCCSIGSCLSEKHMKKNGQNVGAKRGKRSGATTFVIQACTFFFCGANNRLGVRFNGIFGIFIHKD